MLQVFKQTCELLTGQTRQLAINALPLTFSAKDSLKRLHTSTNDKARYDPYQKFEETPSPFKPGHTRLYRQKFFWKMYDGGIINCISLTKS